MATASTEADEAVVDAQAEAAAAAEAATAAVTEEARIQGIQDAFNALDTEAEDYAAQVTAFFAEAVELTIVEKSQFRSPAGPGAEFADAGALATALSDAEDLVVSTAATQGVKDQAVIDAQATATQAADDALQAADDDQAALDAAQAASAAQQAADQAADDDQAAADARALADEADYDAGVIQALADESDAGALATAASEAEAAAQEAETIAAQTDAAVERSEADQAVMEAEIAEADDEAAADARALADEAAQAAAQAATDDQAASAAQQAASAAQQAADQAEADDQAAEAARSDADALAAAADAAEAIYADAASLRGDADALADDAVDAQAIADDSDADALATAASEAEGVLIAAQEAVDAAEVVINVTGTGEAQNISLEADEVGALGDGVVVVEAKQTDAAGNEQSVAVDTDSFIIDTQAPSVVDVDGAGAGDDDVVVDVDAGASTVTITATFDEPMSDTIPTVTLSPEVASTLSETSVEWSNATTLVASYSVSDANIDEDAVSADITGAYDVAGNEIVDYVASVELSIDTPDPKVTGITSSFADAESDGVVSDSDPVVSYTATFSEAVQAVGESNITVTNGALVAGSVVLAGDGLSVTFDAQADDASTAAMTVQVLDTVVDVYGNALDESTSSSSPQSVDTVNPEAVISDDQSGTSFDGQNTVTYSVEFSEPVQTFNPETDLNITGGSYVADSLELSSGGGYTLPALQYQRFDDYEWGITAWEFTADPGQVFTVTTRKAGVVQSVEDTENPGNYHISGIGDDYYLFRGILLKEEITETFKLS